MKKFLLFLVLAMLSLLVACGDNSENKDANTTNDKISVYTTVYPLQYFAEQIGGDYIEVASIYPAGANEHSFEPTQKDMMNLADADLFFYIGLGLEGFVENAEKTLAKEDVKLVAVANEISDKDLAISTGHSHDEEFVEEEHAHDHHEEAVEEEHDHDHHEEATENHDEHDHSDVDPHVWLSPELSKELALSIKNELVALLPEQEATFTANYDALVVELDDLTKKFTDLATTAKTKTFFVSHAAFGYIAGSFGLQQVPISGLNSQSEPSQKELTQIVEKAKEHDVHYILFEQNVPSKLSEVIQNEIGAKSLVLHNLSVLTKEDVKNNETYISLMERNIATLNTALNTH